MRGETRQRLRQQRVVPEPQGPDPEPRGERLAPPSERGGELLAELVRVIHQVPGMDAEEAGQKQPGLVRHVAPRPTFELGEIGQADPLPGLIADELVDRRQRVARVGQYPIAVQTTADSSPWCPLP